MTLTGRHLAINRDMEFSALTMPNPADGYIMDIHHTRCGFGDILDEMRDLRIHRVHDTIRHIARRIPANEQDRCADTETDQWVKEGKPQPYPYGACQNRKRRKAVGARVGAVCDQSRRADLATDARAEDRYEFIAARLP